MKKNDSFSWGRAGLWVLLVLVGSMMASGETWSQTPPQMAPEQPYPSVGPGFGDQGIWMNDMDPRIYPFDPWVPQGSRYMGAMPMLPNSAPPLQTISPRPSPIGGHDFAPLVAGRLRTVFPGIPDLCAQLQALPDSWSMHLRRAYWPLAISPPDQSLGCRWAQPTTLQAFSAGPLPPTQEELLSFPR